MITKRKTIPDKVTFKTRIIFLIDGLGALLTAFMLGVVLATFEEKFGLEPKILYGLAAVALLYAVYSISCYYLAGINWRVCLTLLGTANLFYCFVTAAIIVLKYERLTRLGLTYFVLEILVISLLIGLEFRAVAGPTPKVD